MTTVQPGLLATTGSGTVTGQSQVQLTSVRRRHLSQQGQQPAIIAVIQRVKFSIMLDFSKSTKMSNTYEHILIWNNVQNLPSTDPVKKTNNNAGIDLAVDWKLQFPICAFGARMPQIFAPTRTESCRWRCHVRAVRSYGRLCSAIVSSDILVTKTKTKTNQIS